MAKKSTLLAKPLTKAQEKFVDDVMSGETTAGHGSAGRAIQVKAAIAEARSEIIAVSTLKRIDIIDGIMDGIQMAKQICEPATVIRGWVEAAKILGLDQPEGRKTILSGNAAELQNQLLNMTTAELLEMAAGNMNPIDGECRRVDP